jgi:glycosyltransferase involved in cell wall biosynthesis
MSILPLVSIVTPSYNQGRFLEGCILSILEQDYPNVEYIIMDGGSTDGSMDIIRKYADRLAYWVSGPDGGQSAALNEGLRHATGEIWAWMNSDDAYVPGAIRKAVEWLETHPDHDIVFGDCLVVDENQLNERYYHAINVDLPTMVTGQIGIPSGSTFIRKAVRERIGDFDESLNYFMDNNYWLRAMQVCSFGHIPEVLSVYRVYPSAKTWDIGQSNKRALEMILMYERFWLQSGIPLKIMKLRNKSFANAFLYAAYLASQANDRRLCWYYVRKSIRQGPSVLSPRLMSMLIYMIFGIQTVNNLQKKLHRRR